MKPTAQAEPIVIKLEDLTSKLPEGVKNRALDDRNLQAAAILFQANPNAKSVFLTVGDDRIEISRQKFLHSSFILMPDLDLKKNDFSKARDWDLIIDGFSKRINMDKTIFKEEKSNSESKPQESSNTTDESQIDPDQYVEASEIENKLNKIAGEKDLDAKAIIEELERDSGTASEQSPASAGLVIRPSIPAAQHNSPPPSTGHVFGGIRPETQEKLRNIEVRASRSGKSWRRDPFGAFSDAATRTWKSIWGAKQQPAQEVENTQPVSTSQSVMANAMGSTPRGVDVSATSGTSGGSRGPSTLKRAVDLKNAPEKIKDTKENVVGAASALKKGDVGGIAKKAVGGKVGGLIGFGANVIDKGQKIVRSFGGDVTAWLQLGADAVKFIWNNKGKLLKAGIAVTGGVGLFLYQMFAPLLAYLTPATLAGGILGGLAGSFFGPAGTVAGAAAGAYVGANFGAISAGIANSIAGITGGVASVFGGISTGLASAIAALATPLTGIMVTLAAVGTFLGITVPQQMAQDLAVFGAQLNKNNGEVVVEKTASPSQIDNDPNNVIVTYTVKISNNLDTDLDVKIDDKKITYTNSKGTFSDVTPIIAQDPIPTKLGKQYTKNNPLIIKYQLTLSGDKYNDSVITNLVTVEAKSSDGKVIIATDTANVMVGKFVDHPYGFPVSGALSSVDEDPCGDHWGGFFGYSTNNVHGIDIVGGGNTPVVSTLKGEVVQLGYKNSGSDERNDVGGYIYIQSLDSNYLVGYQHLNDPSSVKLQINGEQRVLRQGDIVERGQTIGTIYPQTLPTTSGPHLHYQIVQKINGVWSNVRFSDPNRAGSCTAEPSESPTAKVVPRVLSAPSFDPTTCGVGQTRKYKILDSVQQDVSCK